MPGGRLAEHHRLGAFVQLAGAALDEIGRQRERRPGEPDQRHPPSARPAARPVRDGADTVEDTRSHALDVVRGAHRMGDHRPDVGHDVQIDAGAAQRDNDVGEQDRRVHPWRCTGCRVISQTSSASKQACIMVLPRSARYSGRDRPACA